MLTVTNKPFMLCTVLLYVISLSVMLSVIILIVIMLSVVILSVIMLSVVASFKTAVQKLTYNNIFHASIKRPTLSLL